MLERKPNMKYVPLRVRFRSTADAALNDQQSEPGLRSTRPLDNEPLVPDLMDISGNQRHAQQIKELVRLSTLLRADLELGEILRQIAASTAACTGFRMLGFALTDQEKNKAYYAVFAGLTEEAERTLSNASYTVDDFLKVMRPEYRISQSYFIPHQVGEEFFSEMTTVTLMSAENYQPGGWHPDDALFVPLFSPREQKLLGILSLDDPEDGKIPTEEHIEIIELFANKAAIAIDNSRLFQEKERERRELEEGIAGLSRDLERLRLGDIHTHLQPSHPQLIPVVDSINTALDEMAVMLKGMRMVAQAVDGHVHSVQHSSELLFMDTRQQEGLIHQVSQVLHDIATMMRSISESAALLSNTAIDAVEVTNEAQGAVDRAVEGMGMVRDATLQSARTMKSLGESGQEITEAITEITDLSTRLHLLSFNAAIEATRAGEHGQGFTLVAKEMRTLATHSSEAARKVGMYVRTFQHQMNSVSQSVEQSTQQVVMQTELVTQTGVALDAIIQVTDQLSALIKGISTTATSQEQGSQLVLRAVDEIYKGTGNITTHMQEMQKSLKHLVELTNRLRTRMASFTLHENE